MDENEVREYLSSKIESVLMFPFGDDVQVYKVKNKMFATLSPGKIATGKNIDEEIKQYWWLNLKCDADEAEMLRDLFPSIIPGYHMNKRHWNTVVLDGSVPRGEIERMMDNSFMLVVHGMALKDQQSILLKTG